MGKHKAKEPTNTAIKEQMAIKYSDMEFAVCEVCHDWCVVIDGEDFHPLCKDTGRYRTIMYARRKEELRRADSLF
jgi:hypothetical protein